MKDNETEGNGREGEKTVALITDLSVYEYAVASAFFSFIMGTGSVVRHGKRIPMAMLSRKRRGLAGALRYIADKGFDTIVVIGDDLMGNLTKKELVKLNEVLSELPQNTRVIRFSEDVGTLDFNDGGLFDKWAPKEERSVKLVDEEFERQKKFFDQRVALYKTKDSFICWHRGLVIDAICESVGAHLGNYDNFSHLCLTEANHDFSRCPKAIMDMRKQFEEFCRQAKPGKFIADDFVKLMRAFADLLSRKLKTHLVILEVPEETYYAKCCELLWG